MITLKIDVKKIDKSRLYVGEKGTYLSCVLIPTPNSEYGDYMVVESVTKAEREAGQKGTILGNGKEFLTTNDPSESGASEPTDDNLPF